MKVKDLILRLQEFPENMETTVSVPWITLDDGYVEEYRQCPIEAVRMRTDMPVIDIGYIINNFIEQTK